MTNENYITIQGWMINELKLSGNELIVYALIYGFSQDNESEFSGSLKYIMKALNISKPTVIKILDSLVNKKLIVKTQVVVNKVKFNRYRYLTGSKETLPGGSKETLPGGSKETLPNNTNINNSNLNNQTQNKNFANAETKNKPEINNLLNRVFVLFDDNIKNRVKKSESQKNKWIDTIEKLNRIDGYSLDEIEKVIKWGRNDEKFWKKNFLSIAKLRDNDGGVLKFEKLKAAMLHDNKSDGKQRTNTKAKRDNLED